MLQTGICILLLAIGGLADTYIRQLSVDVIHYDISLELSDTSDFFSGTTKIHVLMQNEGVTGMWLDFAEMNVDALTVQGMNRPFTHRNGRLSFDLGRAYARNEVIVVEVHYHGSAEGHGMLIQKNRYGRMVVFTDSWPNYAHHWFPSIDHPSDKASATITITAPGKFDVISNGRMVHVRFLPDGRRITQWTESKAIPTYSVAAGIAEFSIANQPDQEGIQLSWYSYPEDSQVAARKFSVTAQALSYFGALIGPYPYLKLAQVQSVTRMQAMENASAIFYSESSFQEDPSPESEIPHEIAHQWFGNSVTPADWDHLWLSEGFATYFAALFYEHLYGPEWLKSTMAEYAGILRNYPFAQTAPVVDPSQTDPMKKLNPINYQKGAWILHMLRGMLGESSFFEIIRCYYHLYKDESVMSEDFQRIVESVSGISLRNFFRQWLYQPGWPQYRVAWKWDESAREAEVVVIQVQNTDLFDMPMDIAFTSGNRQEIHKIRVIGKENRFRIPLKFIPTTVEMDPEGWVLKSIEVASH